MGSGDLSKRVDETSRISTMLSLLSVRLYRTFDRSTRAGCRYTWVTQQRVSYYNATLI